MAKTKKKFLLAVFTIAESWGLSICMRSFEFEINGRLKPGVMRSSGQVANKTFKLGFGQDLQVWCLTVFAGFLWGWVCKFFLVRFALIGFAYNFRACVCKIIACFMLDTICTLGGG